jgi:hypothetical protein
MLKGEFSKYIGVRLSTDGREALRSLVEQQGSSVSEFVRRLIEREARKDLGVICPKPQKGIFHGIHIL